METEQWIMFFLVVFLVGFPLMILTVYGFIFLCSTSAIAKSVENEVNKEKAKEREKIAREIKREWEADKVEEIKALAEDYDKRLLKHEDKLLKVKK